MPSESDAESSAADLDADDLVDKIVVIGITYMTHDDVLISQEQFQGRITAYHPINGIHLELLGCREGEPYRLPPDLKQLKKAEPGEYTLRSTGEVVIDPDYTTFWTLVRPAPIQ